MNQLLMEKRALHLILLLRISISGLCETVTITFDGPPPQPRGTAYAIPSYTESGMLFKPFGPIDTAPPYRLTRNGGGIEFSPDNGTAYLQTAFGDSLEFYAVDRSPFDLITVDLSRYSLFTGHSYLQWLPRRPNHGVN